MRHGLVAHDCVSNFAFGVTIDADNDKVAELAEFFRQLGFANKQCFTCVAPCLQILRIVAVLDEPDGGSFAQVMPAHHRGNAILMQRTGNR